MYDYPLYLLNMTFNFEIFDSNSVTTWFAEVVYVLCLEENPRPILEGVGRWDFYLHEFNYNTRVRKFKIISVSHVKKSWNSHTRVTRVKADVAHTLPRNFELMQEPSSIESCGFLNHNICTVHNYFRTIPM